jgi:hypothetical protein
MDITDLQKLIDIVFYLILVIFFYLYEIFA